MIDKSYSDKMLKIQSDLIESISDFYKKEGAVECHVFGSTAISQNDFLSDVDIWVTFDEKDIGSFINNRMSAYSQFGEVVLIHEMQNNFPLDGIQSAVIYKIDEELVRIDYYLCPKLNSRIFSKSKIIFDDFGIQEGEMIPETKRFPRDLSDNISFLISMCFNVIKKIAREDSEMINFILDEFKNKYEIKINKDYGIKPENSFKTIYFLLDALSENANKDQLLAIKEISFFAKKIENNFYDKI